MKYFSYNDYMDYTENGEINEVKKVEENIAKYELKNETKTMYNTKNKIIKMLKNKIYLRKFMEEFFNLSEIGDIENISYYNDVKMITDNQNNNIICKIEDKEIFILIKVIDNIDPNITYKMFENSVNIIKIWNEEKMENKRRPIVIPIVIYLGKQKWNIDCCDIYSRINYTQCERNRINFSYNIIDINTLEISKLRKMSSNIVKEFINAKINIYK